MPDLVPRDELRSAVALNSASVNVARAVGPAIAGILITIVGVAAVYAGNALRLSPGRGPCRALEGASARARGLT